jgi:hypothetical protein
MKQGVGKAWQTEFVACIGSEIWEYNFPKHLSLRHFCSQAANNRNKHFLHVVEPQKTPYS